MMRHITVVVLSCVLWSTGTSNSWGFNWGPLLRAAEKAEISGAEHGGTSAATKAAEHEISAAGAAKATGAAKASLGSRTGEDVVSNRLPRDATPEIKAKKLADEERKFGVKRGKDGKFILGPPTANLVYSRVAKAVSETGIDFFERSEDGSFRNIGNSLNHVKSNVGTSHIREATDELTDTVGTALLMSERTQPRPLEVQIKEQLRSLVDRPGLEAAKRSLIAKNAGHGTSLENVDHVKILEQSGEPLQLAIFPKTINRPVSVVNLDALLNRIDKSGF